MVHDIFARDSTSRRVATFSYPRSVISSLVTPRPMGTPSDMSRSTTLASGHARCKARFNCVLKGRWGTNLSPSRFHGELLKSPRVGFQIVPRAWLISKVGFRIVLGVGALVRVGSRIVVEIGSSGAVVGPAALDGGARDGDTNFRASVSLRGVVPIAYTRHRPYISPLLDCLPIYQFGANRGEEEWGNVFVFEVFGHRK